MKYLDKNSFDLLRSFNPYQKVQYPIIRYLFYFIFVNNI